MKNPKDIILKEIEYRNTIRDQKFFSHFVMEAGKNKGKEDAEKAGGVEVRGWNDYYDKDGEYVGQVVDGEFIASKGEELAKIQDLKQRMANSPAGKSDSKKKEEKPQLTPDQQSARQASLERGKAGLGMLPREDEPVEEPDLDSIEEPQSDPDPVKEPEKKPVQELEDSSKNFDGSLRQGDVDIATEESIGKVEEMANTDVEDQRFDGGRQSQKEFLDYYSKDSENRKGLDILNSLATANNREKVGQLMKAIDAKDYLAEIEITQIDKRSVSQILLDAGIDVNDDAQLECFKNAHKEINSFVDSKGRLKTSESSELTGSNLGHYEARHIEKRTDLPTMDAAGVQTKGFNLRNDSESNMQCVTPVITDAVYNLLPTPARDELAKSGSPKKYYDPREKNRKGKPNRIRGSAALHMWVMQDGKDAYAAAGRRRSPGEFQVEHIVPLKSGGKDEIENFSMLLKRVNEPRADLSFEKFLAQAVTKAADLMADLSNPETRAKFEKKYRSSKYSDNLAPSVGGSVS